MAAETQYTANTGLATINAANTSLTGSGTLNTDIWTVITGASNGTKVKSVTVKAEGSTANEGMVRLFVYDGSSNTRLVGEIYVPIVAASASETCFERYIELDLDLKANYELRATTHYADTFNIIAEGMDWSYFTAEVRPDSTNYTANTGAGIVSTGNSNLDGTTGTVATIFTAGTSATYKGCNIKSIVIKGTTSSTDDGMVRLFVQNSASSSTKLFTEVFVPITTPTGTSRSFIHQIDFPDGFNLQAGYKILATTEKSNSFTITVEGNDWKYPASSCQGLLAKNFTPASGTAVTTEEVLHSLQISSGMVASGDLFEVFACLALTNNANAKTFKMYINTSNSLSGATQIAQHNPTSVAGYCFSRNFPIVSDTAMDCFGGATTSISSQYATTTGITANVTVPSVSAGFWIIISCTKAVAGDTDTIRYSFIRNFRV